MRIIVVLSLAILGCGGGNAKPALSNAGSDSAAGKPSARYAAALVARAAGGPAAEVRLTDRKERPLIGATIVLTSPSLLGEQANITDEQGLATFAGLPPGDYRMTAYHENQAITTDHFAVADDKTTKVTLAWDLSREPLGEDITVGSP